MYIFKGYGARKLSKEFLNKGWGPWRLNKLLNKLQETGTTARRSGRIESIQNLSFFYCVIFIHKLDIIRKECHLFANFLSCSITTYY